MGVHSAGAHPGEVDGLAWVGGNGRQAEMSATAVTSETTQTDYSWSSTTKVSQVVVDVEPVRHWGQYESIAEVGCTVSIFSTRSKLNLETSAKRFPLSLHTCIYQTTMVNLLYPLQWFNRYFGVAAIHETGRNAYLIILARSCRMVANGAITVILGMYNVTTS